MRAPCLLILVTVFSLNAQMRRQQPSTSSIAGAYNMPSATLHGELKKITGKDIVIAVEGGQTITIDRTHKTKFLREGKEIKPADIAVGSEVTVDVSQDPQLKPLALHVTVDSGPVSPETTLPSVTASPASSESSGESKATPAKPAASPNR